MSAGGTADPTSGHAWRTSGRSASPGDGTTPIDWTTWEDTAKFTAAAALDDRPVPAHLFVAGDRMDVRAFTKAYEAAYGTRLTLERLGDLDELQAETHRRLIADPQNMYAWLPLMYARGVFGGQALPGYQTRTALDQARVSVLCAREYVRDRLDAGDAGAAKAARRLDERIYRFA